MRRLHVPTTPTLTPTPSSHRSSWKAGCKRMSTLPTFPGNEYYSRPRLTLLLAWHEVSHRPGPCVCLPLHPPLLQHTYIHTYTHRVDGTPGQHIFWLARARRRRCIWGSLDWAGLGYIVADQEAPTPWLRSTRGTGSRLKREWMVRWFSGHECQGAGWLAGWLAGEMAEMAEMRRRARRRGGLSSSVRLLAVPCENKINLKKKHDAWHAWHAGERGWLAVQLTE
ncbi:hypothetical protein IWX48DRAFT_205200 [Phyllosticta citricarpa]